MAASYSTRSAINMQMRGESVGQLDSGQWQSLNEGDKNGFDHRTRHSVRGHKTWPLHPVNGTERVKVRDKGRCQCQNTDNILPLSSHLIRKLSLHAMNFTQLQHSRLINCDNRVFSKLRWSYTLVRQGICGSHLRFVSLQHQFFSSG